jgi:Zn finger protein HypA/HybF involved in hydrogenase expression
MHELGLIQGAVGRAIDAASRAGAARIEQISFGLPDDGHLTPETVRELVQTLSVGTIAEGADVVVESRPRPPRRCFGCGALVLPGDSADDCAECGAPISPHTRLPELVLESIAIPEPAVAQSCV